MESAVMDGRRRTMPSLNKLTARDEPASVLTRDSVCHRRLTAINSDRVLFVSRRRQGREDRRREARCKQKEAKR